MSQTIDSVRIAVSDIRTANEIFTEHKFLKKENVLLLNEVSLHKQRFAVATTIDSIKIQRIEVMDVRNKTFEKKSKRRMKWIVLLGTLDVILAVLLFK